MPIEAQQVISLFDKADVDRSGTWPKWRVWGVGLWLEGLIRELGTMGLWDVKPVGSYDTMEEACQAGL